MSAILPASVTNKVKVMLMTRFPSIREIEIDVPVAFRLTERFYVQLRATSSDSGWGTMELHDRQEPAEMVHFPLETKSGKLDADAMRDVVAEVSDIVAERMRERLDMERIVAAFE